MNDIEQRLRAALDARAETFPASPGAWSDTMRRTRAGRLRRRLPLVPVLAAAVAVAVAAVWLAGGRGEKRDDTTAVRVNGLAQLVEKSLRENPPVGEVVTVPHPSFPEDPIHVWYSRAGDGQLRICSARKVTPADDSASCGLVEPLDKEEAGRVAGVTGRFPLPAEMVAYGMAEDSVHSVRVTFRDGRSFPGEVIRGRGLPAPVWTARFPGDLPDGVPVVDYEFADERGRRLQRLGDVLSPPCHRDKTPDGAGIPLPAGVTAHLHADNCLVFWYDGMAVGMSSNHSYMTLGADLKAPGRFPQAPFSVWAGAGQAVEGLWYGYTGERTARVELRTEDGRRATAETVEGFPGQGVRLFGGELPEGSNPSRDGAVYVGYDAGGAELWRHEDPGHKEIEARRTPTG
ncbi:hypothetical protein ACFFMN_26275 [Planobispora siamensis]|uniref:Uncharacterized protein n=1 Tax=Planobispora siamensis TaxID=936338 RepID=A0A8J3WJM2_9ACTN|nr:hypothetical protein [Planobispora siamensis]GIH90827.1 hypothetical protein Psi01_14570 [Planobispora siamensis]